VMTQLDEWSEHPLQVHLLRGTWAPGAGVSLSAEVAPPSSDYDILERQLRRAGYAAAMSCGCPIESGVLPPRRRPLAARDGSANSPLLVTKEPSNPPGNEARHSASVCWLDWVDEAGPEHSGVGGEGLEGCFAGSCFSLGLSHGDPDACSAPGDADAASVGWVRRGSEGQFDDTHSLSSFGSYERDDERGSARSPSPEGSPERDPALSSPSVFCASFGCEGPLCRTSQGSGDALVPTPVHAPARAYIDLCADAPDCENAPASEPRYASDDFSDEPPDRHRWVGECIGPLWLVDGTSTGCNVEVTPRYSDAAAEPSTHSPHAQPGTSDSDATMVDLDSDATDVDVSAPCSSHSVAPAPSPGPCSRDRMEAERAGRCASEVQPERTDRTDRGQSLGVAISGQRTRGRRLPVGGRGVDGCGGNRRFDERSPGACTSAPKRLVQFGDERWVPNAPLLVLPREGWARFMSGATGDRAASPREGLSCPQCHLLVSSSAVACDCGDEAFNVDYTHKMLQSPTRGGELARSAGGTVACAAGECTSGAAAAGDLELPLSVMRRLSIDAWRGVSGDGPPPTSAQDGHGSYSEAKQRVLGCPPDGCWHRLRAERHRVGTQPQAILHGSHP
jgi:hypothetical protein